jgi:hypothetical protein
LILVLDAAATATKKYSGRARKEDSAGAAKPLPHQTVKFGKNLVLAVTTALYSFFKLKPE